MFSWLFGLRNMNRAKVGSVYSFLYHQGVNYGVEEYEGVVVSVRSFKNHETSNLERRSSYRRHDKNFMRTGKLITIRESDGKLRSVYGDRTSKVVRV